MLLRHTASALALAATIALNGTGSSVTTRSSARTLPAPTPAATEVGGGSAALTCLGCVAAGVLSLASGSAGAAVVTLLIGGAEAVAIGGVALTCTTACVTYLSQ